MPQFGAVQVPDALVQQAAAATVAQAATPPARGFFSDLSAQAANTYAQLRYGLPFGVGQATGGLNAQDQAGYTQALQAASKAVAPYQAASVGDLFSGKRGLFDFLGSNAAAIIPQAAGMVAGGLAGEALGGPGGAVAGAIAAGTPGFAGQNVQSTVDETGGLTTDQAKRSLIAAPFQAGFAEAAGYLTPGLGKYLGRDAASGAFSGNLGTRVAKSILTTGAAQAGAGAAMEAGSQYASGDLGYNPDSAGRIADAAVGGFAVGGLLGAFGGFKRSAVDTAKNPIANPDALVEASTNIVNGDATNTPPAPLKLPSPQMFGREPTISSGDPIPVDSQGVALNPVGIGPPADLVSLYDRHNRPGENFEPYGPPAPAAAPEPVAPMGPFPLPAEVQARVAEMFQQSRPDAPEAPLGSQPSLRGLLGIADPAKVRLPDAPEAAPEAATPVEPGAARAAPLLADADKPLYQPPSSLDLKPDEARPLAPFTLMDLDKAAKTKAAEPDLAEGIARERSLRQGELLGSVPTDPATFQARLDEAKIGLRGEFIAKLTAESPQDLVSKVMDEVFENGTTSTSTNKLAQRLGIIDDNLNPLPWVKDALKAKDDAEQAQIKAERDARIAEAAAGKAPEPAAAEPQKTAAPEPAKAAEPAAAAPPPADEPLAASKLPQNAEYLDPAARLNTMIDALRDSEGGKAAIRGSEANELRDLVDAKKFDEAHRRMSEILSAKEEGKIAPSPKDPAPAAERQRAREEKVTPKNEALPIDKQADVEENQREAERVKAIEEDRAARAEAEANKPVDNFEALTEPQIEPRAEPLAPAAAPVEQARAPKTQAEAETAKAAKPPKAVKVAKAEPVPKFEVDRAPPLRARIEALRNPIEGTSYAGIGDTAAQAIHDAVDQGRYDEASKHLDRLETNRDRAAEQAARPAIGEDKQPTVREDRPGSGTPDQTLADAIHGKTVAQAAKYLADTAPSRYHRALFDAVSKLAARLEGPKWGSLVHVIKSGDQIPVEMNNENVAGYAARSTDESGTRNLTVWLHDQSRGGDFTGANYLTTGHELLHAVMMDVIDLGMRGRSGDARLNTLMRDLRDVHNAVINHYNARVTEMKAGKTALTPIEDAYLNGRNNAFADPHETVSWGLTHPAMQEYLQSVPYKAKTNAFMGLIGSMRKLLGLDKMARADTALTELVRIADDALRPDKQQLPGYSRSTYQEGKAAVDGPPAKAESALSDASKRLSDAVNSVDFRTMGGPLKTTARKFLLYVSSLNHIVRTYGDTVGGTREYEAAHDQRGAISQRLQQMGSQAFIKFEKLKPEAQAQIRNIMGVATEFGLDPAKALADHTWLTDAALKTTGVTREQLAYLHKTIVNDYNTLKRQGEGVEKGAGAKVFDEFRSMNDMQALQRLAQSFHTAVSQDELLRGSPLADMPNPIKSFVAKMDTSDTGASVKYFRDMVDAQIKAATEFLVTTRGQLGQASGKGAAAIKATIDPLDTIIKGAKSTLKGLDQHPYFNLGRTGDFFGTAEITKDGAGYAKPESQKAVSKALSDAGINFVAMSANNRQPRFMIRFENESQKVAFDKMALQLAKDGHIDPETMKSGPRDVAGNFGLNAGTASIVKKLQDGIDDSALFDEKPGMSKDDINAIHAQRSALKNMLSDIWLNAQPDTAIARVMARRETRPGYDSDMAHSWLSRWQVGSNALANLTTMPDFTDAMAKLKDTYTNSLHLNADGTRSGDPQTALSVMRELQMRELKTPVNPLADKFDKARGWAHSYYLGANPAYVLTQALQLGTNAVPELSKKYGYAKSFAAMRGATADATSIMRAVMQEMGPLPMSKKSDALAITENVLNKANISPDLRGFLTHMMATGSIDIGSMARAAQQAGINTNDALHTQFGKHADMISHFAAMPATGIELYTRLITALAAQRLHGDYSLEARQYASGVVKSSMFRYQSSNTARAFGKAGFFGRATPMVTQFMSYSTQMIEKLHSEMTDAFTKQRAGETAADGAERRAAAQRFLIGHTAGITALAGTMGLPFATVFAAVLDKSVRASGITGQKDWDATAAYRDFLSSVMGKDIGEVVAHGLPRALGVDMSSHMGEGGLLPMTDFLASKRSWKDSVGDEAVHAAGAMPSMFSNLAAGGSQIADGQVLKGMQTMLPTAIKNMVATARMSQEGYVDGKGQKLPMTPTASAYLSQLLGYTPAQKSEYMEARNDQTERHNILQTRAQDIRQKIINASEQGDNAAFQTNIAKGMVFDQANPGFMLLPTLGKAIEKEQTQRALSVATQSPVGTPIRDLAGQSLTRYANVRYQQ